MADKKLKRYKHLFDRFSEVLHFESFNCDDVKILLNELAEVNFTEEATQYIYQNGNRFRQIVKLIDKAENIAETNDLKEIGIKELKKIM